VPIWPWKSKSSPKVQLIEEFEPPTERVFWDINNAPNHFRLYFGFEIFHPSYGLRFPDQENRNHFHSLFIIISLFVLLTPMLSSNLRFPFNWVSLLSNILLFFTISVQWMLYPR
jgi:hypothetical protein